MRLKLALKLAAAGAVALAVALISASKAIDFETYKGYVAELVEAETGRKLSFGGPVRLRLGLVPSLIADNVSLSNVAGASRPEMIRIERIEAEVALPALLRKEILIQRLIISSPDVILERGNWTLADGTQPKQKNSAPTRFNLRELKVKNARITWRGDGAAPVVAAIHKLTLLPEQGAGGGLTVSLMGDTGGRMFDMVGKLGNLGTALAGKPWPVSLKASAPGTIVSLDGSIATLAEFSGLDFKLAGQSDEITESLKLLGHGPQKGGPLGPMRLSAHLGDGSGKLALTEMEISAGRRDILLASAKGAIRDLTDLSGLDLSVQAEGASLAQAGRLVGADWPALGPWRLAAQIRDDKGGWTLQDLKVQMGGSDAAGSLRIGADGALGAQITASRLDSADFIPKTAAPPAGSARLIPKIALPLDTLRALRLQAGLKADHLILGGIPFSAVTMTAQASGGVLGVPVFAATLAGGGVQGSLSLDARPAEAPAEAVADLRLDASRVDAGKLLHDMGSNGLSGGPADLKLTLKSRGADTQALAANAQGAVLLSLGPGRLHNRAFSWAGGDLISVVAAALNPLAHSRDSTEMRCAVVHFRVKDGVALSDKGLAMQADGIDVVGAGSIDLRSETLDLGFNPRAREGLGLSFGGQVAGLTRLRGTLAAPILAVDELGAARAAASVGAAAATGGLSLLGEMLLDKVIADYNPCRTALAMGAPAAKPGKGGKSRDGGLFGDLFGR